MKKVFLSIVAIAALVALPMSVSAADNAKSQDETVSAKARIITPITFAKSSGDAGNLLFGVIARGATATDVTVASSSATATATSAGDAMTFTNAAYPSHPAIFTYKGQNGHSFLLTIAPPVTGKLSNGTTGEEIVIKNFTSNIGNTGTIASFDGTTQNLWVGATIEVPASTATITNLDYTADFLVTIAYN